MADAASGIATGIVAGAAAGLAVGAVGGLAALTAGTIMGALSSPLKYNPYGSRAVGAPASYVDPSKPGTFSAQSMSILYYRDIQRVKPLTVQTQVTDMGYSYVKARAVGGADYDNVRRPMRGIQIKENTYALLTIETADGTKIFETPNTSAPMGRGAPYSNFILTRVTERIEEKFAILETFGEDFAFFMGAKAKIYEFNGVLMNTEDFPWKAEWLSTYQGFFRGSRTAERRARIVLEFDQEVLRGFLLGTQIQNDSGQPHQCPFSFTMVVIDHYTLEDVQMTEYPHYNIPHGFVFESEYYSNNYESITFQTRKALLGMDNNNPTGITDFMSFLNIDQLYRLAAGALYNYPAILNNVLYTQMQNVLYGRVYRTPQGGMSVDDIDPGFANFSINSIRADEGGLASGLMGAIAELVAGAGGEGNTYQDLMKPMWTSSMITSVFSSMVPINIAKTINDMFSGQFRIGNNGFGWADGLLMNQQYGPIRFNYDEYPGRVPLGGFDGITEDYLMSIKTAYGVGMFGTVYNYGWHYGGMKEGEEYKGATVTFNGKTYEGPLKATSALYNYSNLYRERASKPESELDALMLEEVLLHGGIVSAGGGFAKMNNISTVWETGVHFVRRMWGDAQVDPNSSIVKMVSEVGSWGEYAAEVSRDALHLWWDMKSDGVNLKIRTVDEPSVYRKDSLWDYSGAYTYKTKAASSVEGPTGMITRQSLNEEMSTETQAIGLSKFGINLSQPGKKPWVPDVLSPYVKAVAIDDKSNVIPPVVANAAKYAEETVDVFSPDVTTLNSSVQFVAEESFAGELDLLASKTMFSTEETGPTKAINAGTTVMPSAEETSVGAGMMVGNLSLFFAEDMSPDSVPAYSPFEG
jgi:hypothetical protein